MRRWWLALVPIAIGVIATAVSLLVGDRRSFFVETWIAWLWLSAGCAIAVLVVITVLWRRSITAAVSRGRLLGISGQMENHTRFIARLDHELKNPITAILAGASNLAAADPAVQTIQTQASRLSRLLVDLRKLSEVRSVELELAPVDLEALAREVVTAVSALPEAAQRTISVSFPRAPRPLPSVRADADLLFLAMYNLVANAVKYSGPGDTIELRGADMGSTAVIEIADTGIGIPPAEQHQVWEELARGREALGIPGSGLGLPFVRAIIERHGGSVTLEARAREGTLVRATLPFG